MQTELTIEERHQLLAVLRELDHGSIREKRSAPRRKVLQHLWVKQIGAGAGKNVAMFQGVVVNVSVRGLAMMVRRPLSKQERLAIPLRFADGGGWLVLCEVRNCQKAQGDRGYRVGVYFVDRIEDPDGEAKVPMDWVL
jgi:hypothetical protein